eukprot:1765345-Lingulodinium_polyedra.AAC.1
MQVDAHNCSWMKVQHGVEVQIGSSHDKSFTQCRWMLTAAPGWRCNMVLRFRSAATQCRAPAQALALRLHHADDLR